MFFRSKYEVLALFLAFVLRIKYTDNAILDILENDSYQKTFSNSERLKVLNKIKEMFYFGYDNYMKYAYPKDELNPIYCNGRGPDYDNPGNININDVLGDYQLTLVESLDTLAILGNISEFQRSVQLIIDKLTFEKESTVQVFEATIRVLGALISSHLLITDPAKPFGILRPPNYANQLLKLAQDLANRLLRAFESSPTGIPHPRINLRSGLPPRYASLSSFYRAPLLYSNETCLAGAGSLYLEFAALSKLLNDSKYEIVARNTIRALWKQKSNATGLFGNTINMQTGEWTGHMSGLGAGHDSFYEYLLKSYILFDDNEMKVMFEEAIASVRHYLKRGRFSCSHGNGSPPLYVNVDMLSGKTVNYWVDALQASLPALLVLSGQLDEAICIHAFHYAIWKKFGVLPERFNYASKQAEIAFYPLRPELIESTYFLYQATKNPFYLHVGKEILEGLENNTRAECGYATVHNVGDMSLEDRMESFFLSETCKYLYLLFDEDNPVNQRSEDYLFTTEAHLLPIKRLRILDQKNRQYDAGKEKNQIKPVFSLGNNENMCSLKPLWHKSCESRSHSSRYSVPLARQYMHQIYDLVGLSRY